MNETAIIKTHDFMASPTREFILGLCSEGRYADAREYLMTRMKSCAGDHLLECRNLLCTVERAEGHLYEALRIHTETYPLAERSGSFILKGRFHSGHGVTCEEIARNEGSTDFLTRALAEYDKASSAFFQAGDIDGAGDIENNIGMVLISLGKSSEAREHLTLARAYFVGSPVKRAQVDDTEARLCLSENNPLEALDLISGAIQTFIRHGEKKLLTEAIAVQLKAASDCLVMQAS